ncbi:MAG: recombinase RmuC [Treponema sp. GWB1_62_6]|nr:MAG: recombinase RmuC [Treponema sp. GWC1_61_84]OHE71002.1 MAG: recombinase RmuC [Treponema sp. GWB1_62_6]OHE74198.1 MAG: recombinase RmuC [Treponema sp. RIFOXYC1_FULL_61_9]
MEILVVILVAFAFLILVAVVVAVLRPRPAASGDRLLAIAESQERAERSLREEFAHSREEASLSLARAAEAQGQQLTQLRAEIARFGSGNDARLEAVRETVDRKLREIQADNATRLEQMRRTVDEKLHETLERRLGESFKLVGDRLEQVQAGLGEMRSLAAGVGDLKRVLVNVKNRGTWGEVQLISIVEDILAPGQYELNAATKPLSADRVELAVRLPGRQADGSAPVLLPVDAKFPKEDFERLQEARERGDAVAVEEAGKALERRVRLSAKEIRDKYVAPPATTDFAVLFLASESLFAECLGRRGLAEGLQRDFRVVVAGPTTFAAMLNSLQMGFRTLAVEQRTSEVWRTLGLVKAEFGKFGELLDKTRKKLQEATDAVDDASRKTRTIRGKLAKVEETEELP